MATPVPRRLAFAEYSLDLADERLRRAGEVVHLTPTAFQALRHFALRPERLVTKEEQLATVWVKRDAPVTRESLADECE